MPPAQPTPDHLLGQTIADRFRIISRLGAGGMGVAYRAWDEAMALPVVVKTPKRVFLEDPTFRERFAREIRLLQKLQHAHVVPIVDLGEHDGLPFVVMRFLPGGCLSDRRLRSDDGKPLRNPPGMLHLWLPAVADALDFVHRTGVVHRDVKPANIFFDALWGAFLGDFGIAKVVAETDLFDREATLTNTSLGVGTPEYMAPEVFEKMPRLDGRTDQYALATITYEILAGHRPFSGDVAQVCIAVATQPPPRLDQQVAGLPASAVQAVHRGLAKRPGDRFPNCCEFAAALLGDIPRLDDEPDIARFLCPNCSNLLKLPFAAAGRAGRCPRCREELKVADDLGALWLLDEVRRRQATSSPRPPRADWTVNGTEDGAGRENRVGDPVNAPATSRANYLRWIDSHGLSVAPAIVILSLIPHLLCAPKVEPKPEMTDGSELSALRDELLEAKKREDELQRQFTELQASREEFRDRLAQADAQIVTAKTIEPRMAAQDTERVPELTNSIGIDLRLIQNGTFTMGSEDGDPDEKPMREVQITRAFYIGVTEVTNGQWEQVMGSAPPSRWKQNDHPVEQVSWDDAVEFCRRLSDMPGERAFRRVYRLPSEAEWEYACRAGTNTFWASGDDEKSFGEVAWFRWNSAGQTHPVGQKKMNPWGLYDMHGNVWEWCNDWHGAYVSNQLVNPAGPSHGLLRSHRGGCWDDDARLCRSANRNSFESSNQYSGLGFRLALSPPASVSPEAKH